MKRRKIMKVRRSKYDGRKLKKKQTERKLPEEEEETVETGRQTNKADKEINEGT